jgi:hypothetical protein
MDSMLAAVRASTTNDRVCECLLSECCASYDSKPRTVFTGDSTGRGIVELLAHMEGVQSKSELSSLDAIRPVFLTTPCD